MDIFGFRSFSFRSYSFRSFSFIELLIATLFFILYTPNIVFKQFVKNKSINLLICSLFFIFSVYLVNFILNKGFVEGFKEGAISVMSDSADRAKNAFGTDLKKLYKLNNTSTDTIYSGLGSDLTLTNDISNYIKNYQNYSKFLSNNYSITMPPELFKHINKDNDSPNDIKIVGPELKTRLDCFKNNILNGNKFPDVNTTNIQTFNKELSKFQCPEPTTTPPKKPATTTTTPPKKK